MFSERTLAPGASLRTKCRSGVLPKLREFSAGGAAANRSPAAYEAASIGGEATAATQTSLDFSLASRPNMKRPEAAASGLFCSWEISGKPLGFATSTFDESLLQHLLIAEPEVRNICRAEPKNVLERAADFV